VGAVRVQADETAAEQDDCDRARLYWKKFTDAGGQPSTIQTNSKAFHPWCDMSEVQKNLAWFHLDGDLQGEFPRLPQSIHSYDGKVITISANMDGPRFGGRFGGQEESFDLRLEKQKDDSWKCVSARYRYSDGKYYEGTCSVKMRKWAPDGAPGYDEGTFEVEFAKFPIGDFFQKQKAHGDFKCRREN
jgi:hypothetical protein